MLNGISEEIKNDLRATDLTNAYADLYRVVLDALDGMPDAEERALKVVVRVSEFNGGASPYFASPTTLYRPARHRHLRSGHNGRNTHQLALELGYTDSHVRALLADGRKR